MSEFRVAIVTGAGSGIGRAAAERLAEAGYAVMLVGRTEATLSETAGRIAEHRGGDHPVLVHPADVADPHQCRAIIDAAADRFGRIDALVNAAGNAALAPISETTPEFWRRTLAANLDSIAYLTHAAWPVFKQQSGGGGEGVIVNISSMASIDPFPGFAAYAPAKAAVNMFTRITADEGKKIGLRAVAIAPGAVETPLLRSMFDETKIPPDQCCSPDELGVLIRDCITGQRDFDSGEVIVDL